MKFLSKKIFTFLPLLFITAACCAQVKAITGRVIGGDNNAPLSGVTVSIKGKTAGTATNENGEFSISADQHDVLQISYVGYTSQEVKVDNAATIAITLESNSGKLGEVVVVGMAPNQEET